MLTRSNSVSFHHDSAKNNEISHAGVRFNDLLVYYCRRIDLRDRRSIDYSKFYGIKDLVIRNKEKQLGF